MNEFRVVATFGLMGLAIGWLIGLSTSTVLGIVLTSVMGAVAGIFAAVPGLLTVRVPDQPVDSSPALKTAAILLCALVVGTAIGSVGGVWARTHDWFGPSDASIAKYWKSLGIDEKLVRERIFDSRFPPGKALETSKQGVLFSLSVDECRQLRTLPRNMLKHALESSPNNSLAALAKTGLTEDTLETVVGAICAPS